MNQETFYPRLANIPDVQYLSILARIFHQISNRKMTRKEFREWAAENSLFDRENFDLLTAFLDIRYEDPVSFGDFGTQILNCKNDEERQKVLFERLFSLNPVLMKYVLEALDTEHGGRLHSTNELFRILTSYIYPGKQLTLPHFQNWIKWLQASGYIKYIGVRWGLTEAGKSVLGRMKAVDLEELSEEEGEEEEEGEVPGETELKEEPARETAAEIAGTSETCGVEIVTEARTADLSGPTTSREPEKTGKVLSLPTFIPSPDPAEFEAVELRPIITEDTLFESAEKIRVWWRDFPSKGLLSLSSVLPGDFVKKGDHETLLMVACSALLLSRGVVYTDVKRFLGFLSDQNFFSSLIRGKTDISAVVRKFRGASLVKADGKLLESLACFVYISQQITGFKFPRRDFHGREFVTSLYERFFAPFHPLAPFYMVKLLVTGEIVTVPSIESAAAVPSYLLRENAFRTGFIASVYAASFNDLIDISERVTRFFGIEENFDSPLASLHLGFGCSWRCGRTKVCPLACREKYCFD